MTEVYMDINLGQLKSILETAKNLQMGNIKDLTTLSGVIKRYNQIAQNNGNTQELPAISPYDENLDLDTFYTSFTTSGTSKLTDIITYAEGYINAKTPIPPTINKIEGWNKSIIVAVVTAIIAALITIGIFFADHTYQEGLSSGKAEMHKAYDTEKIQLSKKIESLEAKFKLTNDSLINCKKDNFEKDASIGLLKVNCNTKTKKPVKGK